MRQGNRLRVGTGALSLIASIAGCGGGAASAPAETVPGDPDADPSMVSLPSLSSPLEAMSGHMRFGWQLAEEALALPMPPPPPRGDSAALALWADDELAARRELDMAADNDDVELIVAGAVVGLLYEDVALALRSIPVPSELASDPEIAEIFREVREAQAKPFLEHARRAYRACAANAEQGPTEMTHWSRYCSSRRWRLPE
jgi:hypothetical protein